jgi:uncharacterized protein
MSLGSTRASRVICGAPAANSMFEASALRLTRCVRRGAERCTLGRVRSPEIVRFLVFGLSLLAASHCFAAEVIPPKPDRYFNDYAGVVSTEAALRFNEQLAHFERETSNQIVVTVFPKMQSDSSVDDYTRRVAQNWAVGQKDRRNGAVLFIFIGDRKMFIQVGYGLEGALPDATAFDITEYQIKPHFRTGDYQGGLAAGIDSILKAIRGEYKGTGKTVREGRNINNSTLGFWFFFFVFVCLIWLIARRARRAGYRYSRKGGPYVSWWPSGGWSSGNGGSSGGGGFSGFSGGGGSFGGGGAGSSW